MLLYSNQLHRFPFLIKSILPLAYINVALLYVYIHGFIRDKYRFSKPDLIHLIPLSIGIIDTAGIFTYSYQELQQLVTQISIGKSIFYKEKIGVFSGVDSIIIRQLIFLTYYIFIFKLLIKNKIFFKANNGNIKSRWLILLSVGILLLQFVRISIIVLTQSTQDTKSILLTWNYLAGAVISGSILLYLLYNPKILYGFIFIGRDQHGLSPKFMEDSSIKSAVTEERKTRIAMNSEEIKASLQAIEKYMSDQKPFLRQNCRVSYIAENLDMPSHHFSYLINEMQNKNFRDWLNGYRINYFIENFLLKSDKMTIEALASEAGFSSTATFYSAFKKEMGTSPTAYFKESTEKI
jgi:AraC-like DNA-binding protein